MPTTMSTSPAARPAAIRRRSAAPTSVREQRDRRPAARRAACPRSAPRASESIAVATEYELLGEHLGRRHERALVPALHRHEQRGDRDDASCPTRPRPAAAGASGPGSPCRRRITSMRGALVAGELVRQRARGSACAARRRPCARCPTRSASIARLRSDERHLDPQELVEAQPALRLARSPSIDVGLVDVAVRPRCGPTSFSSSSTSAGRVSASSTDPVERQRRRPAGSPTSTRRPSRTAGRSA